MTYSYNNAAMKQYRRDLRKNSTDVEVILWNILRNNNLGAKFKRQYSIDNYIVDFCCPSKRLVIELDGSQHYAEGLERDKIRDQKLSELDYIILRFSNLDILNSLDGVVMKIQEYL